MERIERLRALLSENDLDAMLLRDPKNRRYITGFPSSEGTVLVTRHETFCFVDSRYIEAARSRIKDATVGLVCRDMPLRAWLRTAVGDCGIGRLGFEEDYVTYADYERLSGMAEPARLRPAGALMLTLRAAKDSGELAAMKRAQAATDAVFRELLVLIRPGLAERELAAEITYRHLLHGAEGDSFPPIVVAGKNSSMPHGVPGDYKICAGDFVTMDFGCVFDGYCSDMTRTVAVGSASAEMRDVYATVLRAQEAGIAFARSGVPGKDIDRAGRRVIEEAGCGEYFGHSFGHSLGLDIHESPSASPTEERVMPEGAVVSAEPGIYLPGKFGVRIEDVLYLRPDGCEVLTKAPKMLIIL